MILQAQATILVEKARAEATAIVLKAQNAAAATPSPDIRVATGQPATQPAAGETPTATATYPPDSVELIGVGMAADGGLIIVQFKTSPRIASLWQQGNVSVTNEANGMLFNEVPVYPSIGPLFGRPKLEGQVGYFMLVNPEPKLRSGDLVTVVMGEYKFEHVKVE